MNYLDYIIIGIVAFYAIWGLANGILKIVLGFLGYVVAFFAAKFLTPFAVTFLNESNYFDDLKLKIFNVFREISPNISESFQSLKIPSNIPELISKEPGLTEIFSKYPKLEESISSNISAISGKGFLDVIAEYTLALICAVIIFFTVKLIYTIIVSIILSRRDNLPLAVLDRILGLGFSVLISVVLLFFAFQIMEFLSITSVTSINDAIINSKFAHIFTSIPLLEWVTQFSKMSTNAISN